MFFFIIASFVGAGAEETVKKTRTITLAQCIDIAVKSHPSINAAKNTVFAGESKVGQAQSNFFPQISGAATGYLSGISANTSAQYSAGLSLNQMIFDFLKTPTNVKIQKYNLDSSRADFNNTTDQVIYNVKIAYYGLLQAKRNRDVAIETVTQVQQHLDQAKGFHEVGLKPKFDVTKAEVDLSNAKLNLIKAGNALKLAAVTLNNALGLDGYPDYDIDDNLTYEKNKITYENSLSLAFKNRPDYKSQQLKTKAVHQSIYLAETGYLPLLSGSASYNWSGSGTIGGNSIPLQGWNAGLALTLPIFSGFLTANQVKEAKANLNVAKANEDLMRQKIILDVEQAFIKIREAEETIPTAELAVTQAAENLELANGRYQAGVGNLIEVADAQLSYINARTSYIQALYNHKAAKASLEKAIGVK
jgi:outer membrane protein TolC